MAGRQERRACQPGGLKRLSPFDEPRMTDRPKAAPARYRRRQLPDNGRAKIVGGDAVLDATEMPFKIHPAGTDSGSVPRRANCHRGRLEIVDGPGALAA